MFYVRWIQLRAWSTVGNSLSFLCIWLGSRNQQCVSLVLSLISSSLDAWRTRQYDYYQRVLNGILWCSISYFYREGNQHNKGLNPWVQTAKKPCVLRKPFKAESSQRQKKKKAFNLKRSRSMWVAEQTSHTLQFVYRKILLLQRFDCFYLLLCLLERKEKGQMPQFPYSSQNKNPFIEMTTDDVILLYKSCIIFC